MVLDSSVSCELRGMSCILFVLDDSIVLEIFSSYLFGLISVCVVSPNNSFV